MAPGNDLPHLRYWVGFCIEPSLVTEGIGQDGFAPRLPAAAGATMRRALNCTSCALPVNGELRLGGRNDRNTKGHGENMPADRKKNAHSTTRARRSSPDR